MVGDLFGQFGGYITLILTSIGSTFGFTWKFFVEPLTLRVDALEEEIETERQFRIEVQKTLMDLKAIEMHE